MRMNVDVSSRCRRIQSALQGTSRCKFRSMRRPDRCAAHMSTFFLVNRLAHASLFALSRVLSHLSRSPLAENGCDGTARICRMRPKVCVFRSTRSLYVLALRGGRMLARGTLSHAQAAHAKKKALQPHAMQPIQHETSRMAFQICRLCLTRVYGRLV